MGLLIALFAPWGLAGTPTLAAFGLAIVVLLAKTLALVMLLRRH